MTTLEYYKKERSKINFLQPGVPTPLLDRIISDIRFESVMDTIRRVSDEVLSA